MVDQKIRKMMIQVSQSQQRRDERKDDRRWQNITGLIQMSSDRRKQ